MRTRAIPERLGGVITTRRYTNPRLPLPLLLRHPTYVECLLFWCCAFSPGPVLFQTVERLRQMYSRDRVPGRTCSVYSDISPISIYTPICTRGQKVRTSASFSTHSPLSYFRFKTEQHVRNLNNLIKFDVVRCLISEEMAPHNFASRKLRKYIQSPIT